MSGLAEHNRRVIAARSNWPPGVLEECERLDAAHPGWSLWWLRENTLTGWERPAGFSASRRDEWGWRDEDGRRVPVRVFATRAAELVAAIGVVEEQIAAARERDGRLWRSIRSMGVAG